MKHLFIFNILGCAALLAAVYSYMLSTEALWGFVQPAAVMLLTAVCTLVIRASWRDLTRD